MTSLRRAASALALGLTLAAAAAPALAARPLDQFYDRTLMLQADARCRYFAPALSTALAAARIQARNAALRSGASPAALAAAEQRARLTAQTAGCDARELRAAADRARAGFTAFSRLQRLDYPGDLSVWRADRTASVQKITWRLSQSSHFGRDTMIFGLQGLGRQVGPAAVAMFADEATPYTARLVLRDAARTSGPYLDSRNHDSMGRTLLSARMPMAPVRAFVARSRSEAPETLLPAKAKTGWLFEFPPQAVDALAELDPREAAMVEFVFAGRGGDKVRRAYIEIGDFAAGRAFLATP